MLCASYSCVCLDGCTLLACLLHVTTFHKHQPSVCLNWCYVMEQHLVAISICTCCLVGTSGPTCPLSQELVYQKPQPRSLLSHTACQGVDMLLHLQRLLDQSHCRSIATRPEAYWKKLRLLLAGKHTTIAIRGTITKNARSCAFMCCACRARTAHTHKKLLSPSRVCTLLLALPKKARRGRAGPSLHCWRAQAFDASPPPPTRGATCRNLARSMQGDQFASSQLLLASMLGRPDPSQLRRRGRLRSPQRRRSVHAR